MTIPMNASTQPRIADLVIFLPRKIFENIAVVMMTPPLAICQAEPEISPRDM